MSECRIDPEEKKIVTEVTEVPGGSIEYRLDAHVVESLQDRNEVRRAIESAVKSFRNHQARERRA